VETREVVIVGGGAMGASVAWHLRQLGVSDVVLLERDSLAAGSTSRSAGGIRTQFSDELNIRIALRSLEEFEAMADEIDLRQDGYLFLLDNEDDLRRFREAVALQQSFGVPTQVLTPAEAATIVPQLVVHDLLAATYCPRDGHAMLEVVVQWYARESGARVMQSCTVTAIDVQDGVVRAVETTRGPIATGCVVCCAGAWSAEVAAFAGVTLPVEGLPRWMWFTPQDGGLPEHVPLTIDFSSGFYFHREGPGLAFGGRSEDVSEEAVRRLPALGDLPVQSSWWGYYDVSPDWNALVGEAPEVSRFLYATGFSGHGFQQAPAVGEHLAQLVVGATPTLDLSPFSAARFAEGVTRPEQFVV
jgi:sarcosine oxidase, subunit beta